VRVNAGFHAMCSGVLRLVTPWAFGVAHNPGHSARVVRGATIAMLRSGFPPALPGPGYNAPEVTVDQAAKRRREAATALAFAGGEDEAELVGGWDVLARRLEEAAAARPRPLREDSLAKVLTPPNTLAKVST
jgi:hypothetical protein